ncbi:MAG TPA: hypothetical protein VNA19_17505 [Pyrinomonadaceae bacterium]|jgi:hypothetical protein|nr:hypothetical protein [Pyrinomonadaceae bacterium]
MLKKLCSLAPPLAAWVLCLTMLAPLNIAAQVATQVAAQADAQVSEKIKADVTALGTGARISLRLRDKKKHVGYLSYIGKDNFVITDTKKDTTQTFAYSDVAQVERKSSRGLSNKAKFAFVVIGGLVILSLIGNGAGG